MIDLHTHVLPVDDGARSFEEALEMCRVSAQSGVRKIVCTPHIISPGYNLDLNKIRQSMRKLSSLLKKENIDIKLIQGAENSLGNSVQINRTRYVMVEFPFTDFPVYAEDIIRELLKKHYVILAHPERNTQIQKNPELIEKFTRLGCYVQLNADSFFADEARRGIALDFVRKGVAQFVATDMHELSHAGNLIKAVNELKKISDKAIDFVTTNPEKVIAGIKL